jgi:transcriptional regulator with XRE-family HTH domain
MDRPGISKCSPKRAQAHQNLTEWLGEWCAENGVSVRELAGALGLTSSVAAKKLSGEASVAGIDLVLLYQWAERRGDKFILSFRDDVCRGVRGDDLLAHG